MDIDYAIKDWSVVVEALGTAKQLFLIRKHQPPERPFFLYPTYTFYTVRPKLLHKVIKTEFFDLAVESASECTELAQNEELVKLKYFAIPDTVIRVRSASVIRRLDPFFVWQPEHVVDYMRGGTIYVWLLRTQQLAGPVLVQREGKMGSVLSAKFQKPIRVTDFKPVHSDEEYEQLKAEILSESKD